MSRVRKEKCCSSSKRNSGKREKCLQVQGRGDGGGGQKVLQASPPLQVSFFAFACQSCFGFVFFWLILVLSLRHGMRVWFRSRERFLGLSVVVIIMVSNLVITDAEE